MSGNTKNTIRDLKTLEDLFDFGNLDKNHDLFSGKNKKIIGEFEIETPIIIWIDEFVCLKKCVRLNVEMMEKRD